MQFRDRQKIACWLRWILIAISSQKTTNRWREVTSTALHITTSPYCRYTLCEQKSRKCKNLKEISYAKAISSGEITHTTEGRHGEVYALQYCTILSLQDGGRNCLSYNDVIGNSSKNTIQRTMTNIECEKKPVKIIKGHLYSATNRKLQLQRRLASQTERACNL